MNIIESEHWKRKKKVRDSIESEMIEYAIQNSNQLRDRYWEDALNAICRIPPSGRILKVIYKKQGNKIKIITAFWLD